MIVVAYMVYLSIVVNLHGMKIYRCMPSSSIFDEGQTYIFYAILLNIFIFVPSYMATYIYGDLVLFLFLHLFATACTLEGTWNISFSFCVINVSFCRHKLVHQSIYHMEGDIFSIFIFCIKRTKQHIDRCRRHERSVDRAGVHR